MSASLQPSATTAGRVLRNRRLWAGAGAMVSVMAFVLTLVYLGGILSPRADLHRLPVGLVNSDRGLDGRNLGAAVADAVTGAPDPDERVHWQVLTRQEADDRLATGRLYGALVIPEDFTADLDALAGTAAVPRPSVTLLTSPGAGSLGTSLASSAVQEAVRAASAGLGQQLSAAAAARGGAGQGATAPNAARLMLADPVQITTAVGHPIGSRSGLGLSALYYSLLLVLAGFLGATLISDRIDFLLGYTASETGPLRVQRPLVRISRVHMFTVQASMSVALAALTSTLVMAAAVGVLDMDAAHLGQLWTFSFCATAAVGLGTQALLTAFGGLGQPLAMLFFVALALPSSGATVPLEALPSFYRVIAEFEPMRQLTGGVRSLLYFDARADAGLARGWTMIGAGALLALALGYAVAASYDRRGLTRTRMCADERTSGGRVLAPGD
ncbi:YhgE/Pip domain-containing protein [Streptomyces sp. NPDC059918]|uniref:YhgE/Pip domain-containing protein n=1 Tax=unclassified Streptomyces TaxID=2593676 RepID=UPI003649D56A